MDGRWINIGTSQQVRSSDPNTGSFMDHMRMNADYENEAAFLAAANEERDEGKRKAAEPAK